MEKKILFLHGLEAGTNGQKAVFLRKTFKNCFTPSLQVSMFKITNKNSFIRNLLLNPVLITLTSFLIICSYFIYDKFGLWTSLITTCFVLKVIVFTSRKYFIRAAVKKSMEANIKIAHKEIIKNKPHILIGSSWGGAVATNLIERGLWNGPTILLAPAYYAVNRVIYNNQKEKIYEFNLSKVEKLNGKVLVYHSIKDETIPFEDSNILCCYDKSNNNTQIIDKNERIELRLLDDDTHGLNSLILEPDYILKRDIELI